MSLFSVVEDAQVIIWENCIYRQCGVFKYKSKLFVKHKGGFIRLAASGQTDHPKVTWKEIDGVKYEVVNNCLELKE